MDQDVALGVTMTITQADIPYLREIGRLGEYAVVYRVYRQQMGGGFGDQEKNPFAWGVLVYVDSQVARLYSARGLPREWSDLTRLEKWMREQGFWYWWMRNDLEPLMIRQQDEDPYVETTDASETATVPVENALGHAEVNPSVAPQLRAAGGGAEIIPLPTQMFNLVPQSED